MQRRPAPSKDDLLRPHHHRRHHDDDDEDVSCYLVDYSCMQTAATWGGTLLVISLLFWGTLVPPFLQTLDSSSTSTTTTTETPATSITTATTVREICLWSGTCSSTILVGHFVWVYYYVHANNSNDDDNDRRRPLTFVVYWFGASLFFNLVWQVPLWATSLISSVPFLEARHLSWAIAWWSYGVSDAWYANVPSLVVVFEIWYLLGNLFGVAGLWYHAKYQQRIIVVTNNNNNNNRHGKDRVVDVQLFLVRALLCFLVCGSLQCYNATVYMFLGWYVDGWQAVLLNDPWNRGIYIYVVLNGFWALASAVAAHTSWNHLICLGTRIGRLDDEEPPNKTHVQ